MSSTTFERLWLRRARPLLGTLVEVGVHQSGGGAAVERALGRAFERIAGVQRCLSRFESESDIGRFNRLGGDEAISVQPDTRAVLAAALRLQAQSDGCFDVSLGTGGVDGWRLIGDRLAKRVEGVRLDLGGIAKGYVVDCAVQQLRQDGIASGWVNAGGDLRVFGAAEVPVQLRDESSGGVRPFATLVNGAFATSGRGLGEWSAAAHVSVAAPRCLWADALTKVVAASGDARHPLLARYRAQAWVHALRPF